MVLKWLAGLLLITGCTVKTAERGYADYINDPDNKIIQKIKVGNVQASMKWMPPAYRSMINNRSSIVSGNAGDDGLYYFDARFEKTVGEKPSKEKILYLNFDMQNDFMLLSGTDSIAPAICQKIENGIAGSYEYMLAFEKPPRTGTGDQDFAIIYRDKIFGIGTIAFVYNQADIKKIPKLKSNKSE